MLAEVIAESEPPGQLALAEGDTTTDGLDATAPAADPKKEEEDAILASLPKRRPKKRNPAKKWDGRVEGMTVKEYRERKWSVDACYAKVERRGPAFSMRKSLPNLHGKKIDPTLSLDLFRAFSATLPTAPAVSMGLQYIFPPRERSPGPAEYPMKSTMDPQGHPLVPKNRGARFGSEVLEPRDPPGPAPGQYELDTAADNSSTLKRAPKPTIQGRDAWRPPTAAPGPGVGEYDFSKAMRTGKMTPLQWNMQFRPDANKKPRGQGQYVNPGPDAYHVPCAPGNGPKAHPMKNQVPLWKFGTEPRGLKR